MSEAAPTLHAVVPPWTRGRSHGGSESAVLACRDAVRGQDRVVLIGSAEAAAGARLAGLPIDHVIAPAHVRARLAARRVESLARSGDRIRWWTHPTSNAAQTGSSGLPLGVTVRESLRAQLGVRPAERCLMPIADHTATLDARALTFLVSVLGVRTSAEVLVLPRECRGLNAPRRYVRATDGIMRLIEVPSPVSGWFRALDGLIAFGEEPSHELRAEAECVGVPVARVQDHPRRAREQLRPILDATGGFAERAG